MTNTQEIMNRDDKNYLPVFNRYKIVLDRGEGVYLYDVTGKKYIDFLAGIACSGTQLQAFSRCNFKSSGESNSRFKLVLH